MGRMKPDDLLGGDVWRIPFAVRVSLRIGWAHGRDVCRSWMTPELPFRPALHARNRRWLRKGRNA